MSAPFDPAGVSCLGHYETLLARYYTWTLGGWPAALTDARTTLQALNISVASAGGKAIDLGCGPGAHVVGLSELGYTTTAVDASATLLRELRTHAPETLVMHDDITHAAKAATRQGFDIVLCLGDTLAHLPTWEVVLEFLSDCVALLTVGGLLALSFRDHSDQAPGDRGLFLVRGDANRLWTCGVEHGTDRVRVTDMLHTMEGDEWILRSSSYDKLPLKALAIAGHLRRCGLSTRTVNLGAGMRGLVASRNFGIPEYFDRSD